MTGKSISYLFLAFALSGCTADYLVTADPALVVEGWIEEGGHPVVMVTSSVPVSTEFRDLSSLEDYVVRWAKVTIDDGTKETVLTGRYSSEYLPPYIYTTPWVTGETGKTYTLSVEYSGEKAVAATSVHESVALDSLKVFSEGDNEYRIMAYFCNDRSRENYYCLFTKVEGTDKTYRPSLMGLMNGEVLGEKTGIQVNMSPRVPYVDNIPYYCGTDVVHIRFSRTGKAEFDYWSDYQDILILSRNPIMTTDARIRSNVSGGLGYWAGYGSREYVVNIRDSVQLGRVFTDIE